MTPESVLRGERYVARRSLVKFFVLNYCYMPERFRPEHAMREAPNVEVVDHEGEGREQVRRLLEDGNAWEAFATAERQGILNDDIRSAPENREAVWRWIFSRLGSKDASGGSDIYFDKAVGLARDFAFPDRSHTAEESAVIVRRISGRMGLSGGERSATAIELFHPTEQEMRDATRDALMYWLRTDPGKSLMFMQTWHAPESMLNERDVREAAKEGFVHALAYGKFDDAKTLEYFFGLSKFDVHRLALDATLASLKGQDFGGNWANALALVDNFHLDIHLPSHAEGLHERALRSFVEVLHFSDSVEDAKRLQRTFALSPEECREQARGVFAWWLNSGKIRQCIAIKNAFGLQDDVFVDPEMHVAAEKGMEYVLWHGYTDDAYVIKDLCALSDNDVTKASTRALIQSMKQGSITDAARDIVRLFHPDLRSLASNDISFRIFLQLISEKEFVTLASQDPWNDGVAQMLKLQARAAKAEHDPWLTDMAPLVEKLAEENVVNREKSEDAALLVDYVKMFGMVNLPEMAKVFLALKRGEKFVQLSPDVQRQLREVIGNKVERMDGEQIVNELRRFRRDVQNTLLADGIPDGMDTAIGTEIFAGLKGCTKWVRNESPQAILATWRAIVAQKPETARLPDGYREHPMRVPLIDRREKVEKPDEAKERKEKIATTLARGTKEKPTELGVCVALLEGAVAELGEKVDRKTWWEGKRAELARTLAFDDSGMEKALQEREAQLKEKNNPPEKIAKILDGVRAGYIRKRAEAAALQDMLRGLEYPDGSDDVAFVAFLERLSGLRRETAVKQTLLALSAEHIRRIAPEWGARLDGVLKSVGGAITTEQITALHDVYAQYVNEHYLGGDDEHHTGHAAFSAALTDALTWAYGLPKDMDGHILAKTRIALEAIEKGDVTVSEESMTVTLVPVHGLLRIYAGDVGDACYTSQHTSLANGSVPDLHAAMFVTNRSTAQERLQGSVLFVETRTPKGENVLLVRANNPRENLIGQVDAASLVKATIDAAIATAKARGIKIVAVPLDAASASCSNRSAVAEYYHKQYAKAPKIALVNEDETNFNGYNNWDDKGTHPSVVVWRV